MCRPLVAVQVFYAFAWFLKCKVLSIFHWEVNFDKDQLSNTNITDKLYRALWDHIRSFV